MRLLRVDYAKSPSSLDLHPLVTVVDGLSENEKTELLEHVRRLASGTVEDFRGLVYHAEGLVELDGRPDITQHGSTEVDPVIAERRRSVGAVPEVKQRVQQARIEELRSRLAPEAQATVTQLQHQLAESERAQGGYEPTRRSGSVDPGTGTMGQPEPVVAVDHETYARVGEAFLAVQQIPRTNRVLSEPVVTLQQRWSAFEVKMAQSEQHTARLHQDLADKIDLVAAAEQALNAAEEGARPVLLTPKQEQRLEELAEKAEGGGRRWRRADQLSKGEQQEFDWLLSEVGAQSWTEYTVFRLAPTVSDDKQLAVDEAQAAFAMAEAEVELARQALDQDPLVAELDAERSAIRDAASQHLGALLPADLGEALLSLGHDELTPEWAGSVTELCRALDEAQLEPALNTGQSEDARSDFERSADQILDWTQQWLATQEQLMATLDDPPADDNDRQTEIRAVAAAYPVGEDAADLRQSLSSAEERLVVHRRALSDLMRMHRLSELEERSDDSVADPQDDDDTGSASLAERLTKVVGAASQQAGGSLPVVVDIDFSAFDSGAALDILEHCSDLAQQAQIIVLSSHPLVTGWARGAGEQVASYAPQTSLAV